MSKLLSDKIQIRNKTMLKVIGDTDKTRILGISIDTSKDVHEILLFDFNGKLLGKSFKINTLLPGYEKLKKKISYAIKKIKAKKVVIGIEAVHICYENISRHLKEDYGNVFFINPFATASNRKQKLLLGLKTDAIDAASIGDLLIRGECYPYSLKEGTYLELQELAYWRDKKMHLVAKLKNQIIHHMIIAYPGLNTTFENERQLFVYYFKTEISLLLIKTLLTPQEIAKMSPREFSQFSKKQGYYFKIEKSKTIVNYFKKILLPPENTFYVYRDMIRKDYQLLEHLEKDVKEVEKKLIALARKTPIKILFKQIKGLSDLQIALYIACLGDPSRFKSAKHVYSYAGLSPKIEQSGLLPSRKKGIKRSGNKLLRTTLFLGSVFVVRHNPFFRKYFLKIRERKSGKESYVAVANKLNRIIFTMMKRQTQFSPPATEDLAVWPRQKPVRVTKDSQTSE